MYLNKIKLFLVISFFLSSFFLTLKDVKSYEIKVVDGDTIHLNGKKIRFSGIDTPELKQTCSKNNQIIFCGIEAKKLLINISSKGIYDHLGGGISRYTVDEQWVVPHFEKMLYDNILLVRTLNNYLINLINH